MGQRLEQLWQNAQSKSYWTQPHLHFLSLLLLVCQHGCIQQNCREWPRSYYVLTLENKLLTTWQPVMYLHGSLHIVTWIHSALDAAIDTSPMDVILPPAYPVIMNMFQSVQSCRGGQDSWRNEGHYICAGSLPRSRWPSGKREWWMPPSSTPEGGNNDTVVEKDVLKSLCTLFLGKVCGGFSTPRLSGSILIHLQNWL